MEKLDFQSSIVPNINPPTTPPPQRPEIFRACFVTKTVETRWLVEDTDRMVTVIQNLPPGKAPMDQVTRHERRRSQNHGYYDSRPEAVRAVLLRIEQERELAKASFCAKMSILRHQAYMLREHQHD